jgi:hypothetical protein
MDPQPGISKMERFPRARRPELESRIEKGRPNGRPFSPTYHRAFAGVS